MLTPNEINSGILRVRVCGYVAALVGMYCVWSIPPLLQGAGFARETVVICLGLAVISIGCVLAYCGSKLLARCPVCHASFWRNAAQTTIATKHCGFCGSRVVADI